MTDEQTTDDPTRPHVGPIPFAKFFELSPQNIRLSERLGMDLAALAQEVTDSGKSGKLTLTIALDADDHRMLTSKITYKVTPPPGDPSKAIWFIDDAGGLHRDDPYQRAFDFPSGGGLTTVTGPGGKPIDVDPATGVVVTPGDTADTNNSGDLPDDRF